MIAPAQTPQQLIDTFNLPCLVDNIYWEGLFMVTIII